MSELVSIIVNATNPAAGLRATLEALPRSVNGAAFEVIVIVDTPPAADTFAGLPFAIAVNGYPAAIAPGERLNDAIAKAGGDAIAIFPAGALPERHWTTAIRAAFTHPDVAGVVPRVLDGSGTHVRACGTGVMNGRFAHSHAGFPRDAKYVLRPTGLDLAPICGLVLRAAHIGRVHGFDPAYTTSMFDFDWTLRARIEGLVIAYRPDYSLRYDGPLPLGQTAAERTSVQHFYERWQTVFQPNLRAEAFLP